MVKLFFCGFGFFGGIIKISKNPEGGFMPSNFFKKTERINGKKNYILASPILMTTSKKIISIRSDNKVGIEIKSPEGEKKGFISFKAAMELVPEMSHIAACILLR